MRVMRGKTIDPIRLARLSTLAIGAVLACPPLAVAGAAADKAPESVYQEVSRLTKEVAGLKRQLKELKAENERLRKELAEANSRRSRMERDLQQAKPVEKKTLKITDNDITPDTAKRAEYRGAELLLNGYVVDTRSDKGEFVATIAAGEPDTWGKPLMLRSGGAKAWSVPGYKAKSRLYQVQVRIAGKPASSLRTGGIRRRVRGIVRKITVEGGNMFAEVALSYSPQTIVGLLIVVELDSVTVQ